MFGLKKHVTSDELIAPITGQIVNLNTVSDPVFAQGMMGAGFAIKPDLNDSEIVAPISGKITVAQGHAVGIVRDDGLEFLLHIGIDTVSLKGAPFNSLVKPGKRVKAGTPLVEIDWQQITTNKLDPTVMVLIPNSKTNLGSLTVAEQSVTKQQMIGQATIK
ncbi:PTS sugar transporter subunit IIA [Companilactobacillus nantensis]|uniref:PTS family glucose glucoside (Glc) porter component IIA n=1 Tax=Companilactobacillus nantensis DSM 16982 TaxID=1423774 RepID=A0A0R1WBE5_9LACO|nr:PTS glucose transporter subunit IIA [Companilactobacillus nantensis]KRM15055.1 PTS family glucose glucoside (glc) porter component IIA [Companilactobacillus nantensis DSM 16982]GEO63297.1 PTS sugar transporter subunit IIA [Companilactobacillus nantensis]